MEITGRITRCASVIASEQVRENKQSVFLVEGRFTQTDKLFVTQEAAPSDMECYILTLPAGGSHYVRYQLPEGTENVRIYVSSGSDAEETEAVCENFGRYLRFPVEGNVIKVRVAAVESGIEKKYIIGACAAAFILVCIVILIIIKKRFRKKPDKVD